MSLLHCLRFTLLLLFFCTTYLKDVNLMKVKFTNVQTEVYDKTYATFKRCELKALARDRISLSVYAQMHKLPINNIQLNVAFFRKANGYRPFLYNTTMDFCNFVLYPHRYMFWKIFYDILKSRSNVNHTCPYNHDLSVDALILNGDMFNLIPFPTDEYMFRLTAGTNNTYKGEIRFYFKIYD